MKKEKVVTVKWDLGVAKYSDLISDMDDYGRRLMGITDTSYCKMCALQSGPMCLNRSICRSHNGETFVNRGFTFIEESEREIDEEK